MQLLALGLAIALCLVPGQADLAQALQTPTVPSFGQTERRGINPGNSGSPKEIAVEWLDISGDAAPRVLAKGQIADDGTVLVPRSAERRRTTVLRFLRTGAAPVSVRADALSTGREFVLPATTEGAELFVELPAVTFQPVAYRVVGAGIDRTIEPNGQMWFRVGGLPAASYQILPHYRGGMIGASHSAAAKGAETTFLRLRLLETGALDVSADERLCSASARIELSGAAQPVGRGNVTRRDTFPVRLNADCRSRVEGLAPGTFAVAYRSAVPDVRLSETVAITGGDITVLSLVQPETILAGRVLRDGRPLTGKVELLLTRKEVATGSGGDVSTLVETTGDFRMTTDREGEHRAGLRLNGSVVAGVERVMTLSRGVNTLDWDVPLGRVKVDVRNWSRGAPVRLLLRTAPTSVGAAVESQFRIDVTDPLPVALEALGLQTYRVQAIQESSDGPRLASPIVEVNLVEGTPSRDIALELQEYKTTVSVVDSNRNPLPDAVVTIGGQPPLSRRSDGLFELGKLMDRQELRS